VAPHAAKPRVSVTDPLVSKCRWPIDSGAACERYGSVMGDALDETKGHLTVLI